MTTQSKAMFNNMVMFSLSFAILSRIIRKFDALYNVTVNEDIGKKIVNIFFASISLLILYIITKLISNIKLKYP